MDIDKPKKTLRSALKSTPRVDTGTDRYFLSQTDYNPFVNDSKFSDKL